LAKRVLTFFSTCLACFGSRKIFLIFSNEQMGLSGHFFWNLKLGIHRGDPPPLVSQKVTNVRCKCFWSESFNDYAACLSRGGKCEMQIL